MAFLLISSRSHVSSTLMGRQVVYRRMPSVHECHEGTLMSPLGLIRGRPFSVISQRLMPFTYLRIASAALLARSLSSVSLTSMPARTKASSVASALL